MQYAINLDKPLLDLDMQPVDGATMAKQLARSLVISQEGDPIKYLDWAIDLQRKGILQADSSDLDNIQTFVKSARDLTNLSKGQLLKEIKAQRELAAQNK